MNPSIPLKNNFFMPKNLRSTNLKKTTNNLHMRHARHFTGKNSGENNRKNTHKMNENIIIIKLNYKSKHTLTQGTHHTNSIQ